MITSLNIHETATEIKRLAKVAFDNNGHLDDDGAQYFVTKMAALLAYTPAVVWDEIVKNRDKNDEGFIYSTVIINPYIGDGYHWDGIIGGYAYIFSQPHSIRNMKEPLEYHFTERYKIIVPDEEIKNNYYKDYVEARNAGDSATEAFSKAARQAGMECEYGTFEHGAWSEFERLLMERRLHEWNKIMEMRQQKSAS